MKRKESATRITIYIDKEVHKQSKFYCIENEKSLSSLIQDFLKDVIEKEKNSRLNKES